MERRHKHGARNTQGRVNKDAAGKDSEEYPLHLPNIAELIKDGEITIGVLRPVGCVAVANDGHNTLAMLVRQKGEPLDQLLTRLDRAIAKAHDEAFFTDEINPPPTYSKRS
jgi:hypothetical protein